MRRDTPEEISLTPAYPIEIQEDVFGNHVGKRRDTAQILRLYKCFQSSKFNSEDNLGVPAMMSGDSNSGVSNADDDIRVTDEEEQPEMNKTVKSDRDHDTERDGISNPANIDALNNNTTDTKPSIKIVNNNNIKSKLTFGIDSILRVKTSTINKNDQFYDNCEIIGDTIDDGEQLGAYNTSDDEDQDSGQSRIPSTALDADTVRARLALLRYSTTAFSAFNAGNGNCVRPGSTQQTVFPPSFSITNTGSGGYAWRSVAATAAEMGRKDRYEFVRRVGHPYQNRTPPKRKKPRTSFTRLQILELEKRFERQKYLASTERSALAKSLKMSDGQVKTWFQNRRTKWRRQTAEEREIERQAANRLLMSLQAEPGHRKSVVLTSDPVCLSHFQRWQDQRSADV